MFGEFKGKPRGHPACWLFLRVPMKVSKRFEVETDSRGVGEHSAQSLPDGQAKPCSRLPKWLEKEAFVVGVLDIQHVVLFVAGYQ